MGPGVASDVVALGKLKIHRGDDAGAGEVARIAEVMLKASAPGVRRHAAWYLALYSMYRGDPGRAHNWLCALGYDRRFLAIPTYPVEATDAPQLTRIAMAVGDHDLAEASVTQAEGPLKVEPWHTLSGRRRRSCPRPLESLARRHRDGLNAPR